MKAEWWQVVIALLALIGPSLVALVLAVGRLYIRLALSDKEQATIKELLVREVAKGEARDAIVNELRLNLREIGGKINYMYETFRREIEWPRDKETDK